MGTPSYEVISLHVASDPHRTIGTNFFFDAFPASPDLPMPQDYLFWVVRGDGRCIVVDTCFTAASAAGRGRRMHRPVEAHLQDLGLAPADVTDVVMTHLHWDHAGNIGMFPNATIHVQSEELSYCTGAAMLHRPVNKIYSVEDIQTFLKPLYEGRVNLFEGDAQLFPGISVVKVGGHTPGSQVMKVSTRRGELVLASDAAHFWANIQRHSPFPILDSFPQALRAFDRIRQLAEGAFERIIPGHDPLLRSCFPPLRGHDGATCLHLDPVFDVISVINAQFNRSEAA